MAQKIFITYADEKFALSEKQVLKEARSLGIFDKCIGYMPKDLPVYIKANPLMAFVRGGVLVLETVCDMEDVAGLSGGNRGLCRCRMRVAEG